MFWPAPVWEARVPESLLRAKYGREVVRGGLQRRAGAQVLELWVETLVLTP